MRAWVLASSAALVACAGGNAPLPPARETPGRAVPVPEATTPRALGAPALLSVVDRASSGDHSGRAPRRLSVDQLRGSLLAATGFTWFAQRTVSDPESASGSTRVPDADMLEVLAATLGRADYVTTTKESLDPAVTFAKLASDAARSACRASIDADVQSKGERRIVRFVGTSDTVASNSDGVTKNLAYLALRFWGRRIEPADPELRALTQLFDRASTAPPSRDENGRERNASRPPDGWRAVCIAMATDPQFLTY